MSERDSLEAQVLNGGLFGPDDAYVSRLPSFQYTFEPVLYVGKVSTPTVPWVT